MEYYSAIKKNEIMPFATTWLDPEIIKPSEVSQRKTNIIRYHFYMESILGTIKDRNGMELTEAEDIKKRWQENTEERNTYKKDLHDTDNHDGVITHLEPGILECEIKWALGSITMNKASTGDGIPVELFQILKDDAVKVLDSMCQQVCKTQ